MEKESRVLIELKEAMDRLDNDMNLYMILVDAFLQDKAFQPTKMREIERAFRESGATENLEAAQYIHRMKGAARQLGAVPLATEAQKLEDIFRGKATATSFGTDTATLTETILDLHTKTIEDLKSLSN